MFLFQVILDLIVRSWRKSILTLFSVIFVFILVSVVCSSLRDIHKNKLKSIISFVNDSIGLVIGECYTMRAPAKFKGDNGELTQAILLKI